MSKLVDALTDEEKAALAEITAEDEQKKNQATRLVELALAGCTLFHDEEQEAWAAVPNVGGGKAVMKVKSKAFRRWLVRRMYLAEDRVPKSDAMTQARNTLEAEAVFNGPKRRLFLRVAEHSGAFWYDLGRKDWRAVRIEPGKWEVVPAPILFKRERNTAAQVLPAGKGDLFKLLEFVNVTDPDDQLLMLVWTVTALIPGIPHTVPVLAGEKGACKSTTMRVLRELIDPAVEPALALQDKQDELALTLAKNYCASFDNLDGLRPWQSDLLCRAVTGGGWTKRELYSDEDEVILRFQHAAVILNGINPGVTRADLLDRAIIFNLERVPEEQRREEKDFWQTFNEAKQVILAGLFDALAGAMEIYPKVDLKRLPRMADFTRWGYAVAEAIGAGGEEFLAAYYRKINQANEAALENHPVAAAVVAFLDERESWTGTPARLLEELTEIAEREKINVSSKAWPKAAHVLTRRLKEVKSNLQDAGILFECQREPGGKTGARTRIITIQKGTQKSVPTDPSVPNPETARVPVGTLGGTLLDRERKSVPKASLREASNTNDRDARTARDATAGNKLVPDETAWNEDEATRITSKLVDRLIEILSGEVHRWMHTSSAAEYKRKLDEAEQKIRDAHEQRDLAKLRAAVKEQIQAARALAEAHRAAREVGEL